MSGTQIFVCIFATLSVATSAIGIWRVAKAPEARYKPLWIIGCLFGFIGVATSLGFRGDLYVQFGVQIPVLMIWTTGSSDLVLKVLFPIVAAIAWVKFKPRRDGHIN